MGYSVSGEFAITVTSEAAVTASLTELPPSITRRLDGNTDIIGNVIEQIMLGDIFSDDVDENGTRTLTGYVLDKWGNESEDAFTWLAVSGCGIDASFRGEDDYQWAYTVPVGSGVLLETSLVSVPSGDIPIANAAKKLLKVLAGLDVSSYPANPALNEALTELVASSR